MSQRQLILGLGAAALIATGALWSSSHGNAETAMRAPAPAIDEPPRAESETAVIAGGCFWGVQGVFQHVRGVTQALSGYSGGSAANAHYGLVGTGETGHAAQTDQQEHHAHIPSSSNATRLATTRNGADETVRERMRRRRLALVTARPA